MTKIKGKITLLICLILSLLMIFVLSSCDKGETPADSSTNTGNSSTNTDTSTDSSTVDSGTTDSSTDDSQQPDPEPEPDPVVTYTVTFVQEGFANVVKTVNEGEALTDIPTPQTVQGYEIKWEEKDLTNIQTNITVNAVKTLVEYNVIYVLNGGTNNAQNPDKYTIEQEFSLFDPSRAGYTFAGWYSDSGFTTAVSNIEIGETGSKTFYAKWDANENTIVFNANSGNGTMSSITATTDSTVKLTTNAFTKDGYTFKGWATTASGSVEYTDGASYTMGTNSSYTLYAVWEANQNTLVFNANGGTGTMSNMTIATDASANLTNNTFTKDGYTFMGWATTASGSVEYTDGASYTMGTNSTYTLYAVWQVNINGVIFNANGGKGTMSSLELATGVTDTLPKNTFTRAGYTFKGWATTSSGSVSYADESSYTMGTNSTYTLYAVWQANTNTLKFNANGGTGSMSNMTIATDASKNLTSNTFTRTGYTFKGWATSANGSVVYQNGASYKMGTNSSYTLYAVWKANQNTLVFNANGGNGSMSNMTIATDSTAKLTSNAFTKAGYTFKGWATSANGSVVYQNGASYKMGTNSSYTLYAVWQANNNTLVFNANGGSGTMSNMTIATDASANLTNNTFTRAGYTFKGWATSASGSVEYANGASYTMGTNSTYTLYAIWQANTNTLVFDANGGSGSMSSITGATDSEITLPTSTFTKENYEFIGWSTTKDGSVEYTDGASYTMGAEENNTLYAVWDVKKNDLIFNSNDAKGEMSNFRLLAGETGTLPLNTFTKAGYKFAGWSTTKDGSVEYTDGASYTMGTEEKYTLYAVWTVATYKITYDTLVSENPRTYSINTLPITLYAPTTAEAGKIFAGWCTTSDFSDEPFMQITEPIGAIKLYAKFVECTDGLVFTENGDTYAVTDYTGTSTSVVIPDIIMGKKVTAINVDTFINNITLESITIGKNIADYITIDDVLYSKDGTILVLYPKGKKATNYVIPNTVTTISANAFSGCTSLTSVIIGDSVTSIGSSAFEDCTSLTSITIPDSVTTIRSSTFSGCTSLTSITLGARVTSIDANAFSDCTNIEEAVLSVEQLSILPKNVFKTLNINAGTTISSSAFAEFTSLEKIILGDSIVTISVSAFSGVASSLKALVIGNGVTSLPSGLLSGCSSLESLTIPFVGGSKNPTTVSSSTLFGCIFGSESYNGGMSTKQYYSSYSYATYYIPSTLKNVVVTGGNILYGAFENCTSLESVVIPNSVTSIGSSAFRDCTSLTSVEIPNSVTSIGDYAFYDCTSLTSVNYLGGVEQWCNISFGSSAANPLHYAKKLYLNGELVTDLVIPSTVTNIKAYAFYNCDSLTSITIPNSVTSIGDYAFYSCDLLTSVTIPSSVTSIGDYAFYSCDLLTSVTIPSSVTSIGSSAFEDCTSLTSITIPDRVTSIGLYAFNGCTSLESITIPSSVTSIGYGAFWGCTSLTSVTIPSSVTMIGSYAFTSCTSLTSVNYLGTIEQWCNISFGNSPANPLYYAKMLYLNGELVTDLVIPNTVTQIKYCAFYKCTSLTSVTIPSSVTSIGSSAFYGCTSLTSVEIPSSVTSIGSSAFEDCTSLTSITIPSSVTTIGSYGFSGCTSLTSVTIPNSVTSIGNEAFYNCTSLTSVTIPNSVTSIGNEAFYNCTSLTSVTIPSSVTSIGSSAFYKCTSLTSVTIGDSVTSIGSYAFEDCTSLTSITIPDRVTSIGKYAFYNCTSLTSVNISDIASWCNISFGSSSANPLCYGEKLYLNGTLVTDLVIPSTVTKIKPYAFYGCTSLTSVTIGNSVTSIGDYAFYSCDLLTSVTIPSSVTSIGDYAFYSCDSLTIYCEATEQPSGWDSDWNYSNCPVVWGIKKMTLSFEANGGNSIDPIFVDGVNLTSATLPTPTRQNYTFLGWYENADFSGEAVSSPYFKEGEVTLYAKWELENDGTSFDKATIVQKGNTYNLTIDESGELIYLAITPTETKEYTISSAGNCDVIGYLYDSSQQMITFEDGDIDNFTMTETLTVGQTYYIVVEMYDQVSTGSFTITIN